MRSKAFREDLVRYHVCWGSWPGPHTTDVPLSDIVDLVLQVRAGAYVIEGANPRHEHEWQVWESVKLPAGKVLIPGVISHATNIVEHPELVASASCAARRLVGRENVIAGTDCGFAQGPFTAASTPPSCGRSSKRSPPAPSSRAGSCGGRPRRWCRAET